VLIAAYSGRALAAAARRAGYAPLVADLFADEDTGSIAAASLEVKGDLASGFDADSLLESLDRLSGYCRAPIGFVYGAGFEAQPSLLAEIGRRWPVLGNAPEVLARLKDPGAFAAACGRLGIPHPETQLSRPPEPEGWLRKGKGGAGGGQIAPATAGTPDTEGAYFQRRVEGKAVSALFAAARGSSRIIGFSEQWRAPTADQPYRFGGAVRPADLPPRTEAALTGAVHALAGEFGLRGLNSADFLIGESGWWLLEVNPRPGATLDLFDSAACPLFALHMAAVRDRPLPPAPRLAGAAATRIVYAPRAILVPAGIRYPEWTADRPRAGAQLRVDDPFCTVLAREHSACEAVASCTQRAGYWLTSFDEHEEWMNSS
jgi:predicted ATP-grasp superfamily ATP-dependent carboligase